jgi:hypothetical protein
MANKFTTIQVETEDKDALLKTAQETADKLGMKKLSLAQLIHMMHEKYKADL